MGGLRQVQRRVETVSRSITRRDAGWATRWGGQRGLGIRRWGPGFTWQNVIVYTRSHQGFANFYGLVDADVINWPEPFYNVLHFLRQEYG